VFLLSLSCSSSRSRVLALALAYSLLPSHSRSRPRFLTLVIAFPRLHSLAFRLSPLHIAYYVKFNYYLITHIIGRVTHPLASLSSTSSSVFILIVFIIIDTASISFWSPPRGFEFQNSLSILFAPYFAYITDLSAYFAVFSLALPFQDILTFHSIPTLYLDSRQHFLT
jgi:hypothetical protein